MYGANPYPTEMLKEIRKMTRVEENQDVRESIKKYISLPNKDMSYINYLLLADISKSLAIIADRIDGIKNK